MGPKRGASAEGRRGQDSRGHRIALVLRHFSGVVGGAEKVVCQLATGLAEAGNRVTILHWDKADGPPAFPLSPAVRRVNLHRGDRVSWMLLQAARHVPYWRLRHRLQWQAIHGSFRAGLAAWLRSNRPDLVISFMPNATTCTLLAAKGTGIPVIASFRTDPHSDFVSRSMWDQNEHDRRLRLSLLREAAAVHVLLPEFVSFFVPEIQAKTVAIPNGLPAGIASAVGTVPRRPVILGLGRLAAQKNFKDLIEAWAMIAADHPDWSVEIHGEGEERPMLQALIRDRGVERSCRLPGVNRDVPRLLGSGSIFCHPSTAEGFPRAPTEALMCGLPVVAYDDCPGLSALVRHEQNSLVVPRVAGPAGLAAALQRLIRDEALRARLAAAAPASVADFTEEACMARWCALIDRVIARRPLKEPIAA